MKKLLGLLALAPMTLAACGGNTTDTGTDGGSDNGGSDTGLTQQEITVAYAATSQLGISGPLTEITGKDGYNASVKAINEATLDYASDITGNNLTMFNHDWTKESEVSIGGDIAKVNYHLEDGVLSEWLHMAGDASNDDLNVYTNYIFEIVNGKLEIQVESYGMDGTAQSYVRMTETEHTEYNYSTGSISFDSILKTENEYASVVYSSGVGHNWTVSGLNTTNETGMLIGYDPTGTETDAVTFNDLDATDKTSIDALLATAKFPGTDVTWEKTIKSTDFTEPTFELTLAQTEAKFA